MCDATMQNRVMFDIQCKDGATTYLHIPGKYCWRFIDKLAEAGTSEYLSRRIDLSEFLTCRAVKILEQIFGAEQPIHILSTTTGYSSVLYDFDSTTPFHLHLSIDDMGAVVDCLRHCTRLDMRYRDFQEIEDESKALALAKVVKAKLDKQDIFDTRKNFALKHFSPDLYSEYLLNEVCVSVRSHVPRSQPPTVPVPHEICNAQLDGEYWTLIWSRAIEFHDMFYETMDLLHQRVMNEPNPSGRSKCILPILIFASIIYAPEGYEFWPVEQVLHVTTSHDTMEAIKDYMPLTFGKRI